MHYEQLPLNAIERLPIRIRREAPAVERKKNGQWLSSKKAGEKWMHQALAALTAFIEGLRKASRDQCDVTFTFDAFRAHFVETLGNEEPASLNAWGSLPRAACKAGICEWTGTVDHARRSASHARLVKVWRAL